MEFVLNFPSDNFFLKESIKHAHCYYAMKNISHHAQLRENEHIFMALLSVACGKSFTLCIGKHSCVCANDARIVCSRDA